MIYGYARVSTPGQDLYGTSMSDQVSVLKQNGAEQVYREKYTGTKMHRPAFDELMESLRPGDTLIVTKLDRLGRSSDGIIALIKDLLSRDITVKVLNMGTLENTPVGRMIVAFLAGFAEFERDLIVERTKAGKDYKRMHDPDFREGRRPKQYDAAVFRALRERVVNGEISVKAACATLGVGRSKWYEIVREQAG